MPNSTVPANATALPASPKPLQVETVYCATTHHPDFDADDSGAMAHVIADEEEGPVVVRTPGGEHRRNFASFNIKDLAGITADDPHEAFLVAFKTLIAAPWSLNCTDIETVAR